MGKTSSHAKAYDFIVQPESATTVYVVRDSAGVRTYSSTYSELAIQEAIDSLDNNRLSTSNPWHEKILTKGLLDDLDTGCGHPDSLLEIPSYIMWEHQGTVRLADNVDTDMVHNEDQSSNGNEEIHIYGKGVFDGKHSTNNNSSGFVLINPGSNPYDGVDGEEISIAGVSVLGFDDDLIHIDNSNSGPRHVWVHDCRLSNGRDRGLYLKNVSDSVFSNIYGGGIGSVGTEGDLIIEYGVRNRFDSLYLSGGGNHNINLKRGWRNVFTNCHIDNAKNDAVSLNGTKESVFSNMVIVGKDSLAATNTYCGIKLQEDGTSNEYCIDNNFSNINILCWQTDKYQWGIEEADSNQDYNIYVGINGRDCNAATLRLLGSNSTYGHIIGGVITT